MNSIQLLLRLLGLLWLLSLLRLTVAGDDSGRGSIHHAGRIVQLLLLLLGLLWLLLRLAQSRSYATGRSNNVGLHRLLVHHGIVGVHITSVFLAGTIVLVDFVVRVNVLIAENIIMDVILLRRLGSQHEGLRETTHRLAIVGQFTGHLNNDAITEGSLRIHLADLGMTVAEVQLLDLVMDLLLTDYQRGFLVFRIQTAMNEARRIVVESVQVIRRLVQQRVILAHEFAANALR